MIGVRGYARLGWGSDAAGPTHAAFRLGIILDLVGIGECEKRQTRSP